MKKPKTRGALAFALVGILLSASMFAADTCDTPTDCVVGSSPAINAAICNNHSVSKTYDFTATVPGVCTVTVAPARLTPAAATALWPGAAVGPGARPATTRPPR